LDQKTLAERVGVSRYWIIDIESGKAGAEVGLVLQTLRALGLNLEVAEEASQTARGGASQRYARTGKVDADALVKSARERRK
jgi:HTH-type transcriptional regulator/antitoxin HipB